MAHLRCDAPAVIVRGGAPAVVVRGSAVPVWIYCGLKPIKNGHNFLNDCINACGNSYRI